MKKERMKKMEKNKELIESIDIATEKGRKLIADAKDFIAVMEILITAAISLRAILIKNDGGSEDE